MWVIVSCSRSRRQGRWSATLAGRHHRGPAGPWWHRGRMDHPPARRRAPTGPRVPRWRGSRHLTRLRPAGGRPSRLGANLPCLGQRGVDLGLRQAPLDDLDGDARSLRSWLVGGLRRLGWRGFSRDDPRRREVSGGRYLHRSRGSAVGGLESVGPGFPLDAVAHGGRSRATRGFGTGTRPPGGTTRDVAARRGPGAIWARRPAARRG